MTQSRSSKTSILRDAIKRILDEQGGPLAVTARRISITVGSLWHVKKILRDYHTELGADEILRECRERIEGVIAYVLSGDSSFLHVKDRSFASEVVSGRERPQL